VFRAFRALPAVYDPELANAGEGWSPWLVKSCGQHIGGNAITTGLGHQDSSINKLI